RLLSLSPSGKLLTMASWPKRPSTLPAWVPSSFTSRLPERWQKRRAPLTLFDVFTGEELALLPEEHVAEFLSDGKTLMTYDIEQPLLRLWDLPPRMLLPAATPWLILFIAGYLSVAWWRARSLAKKMASRVPSGR